jgi:hypothetical protein
LVGRRGRFGRRLAAAQEDLQVGLQLADPLAQVVEFGRGATADTQVGRHGRGPQPPGLEAGADACTSVQYGLFSRPSLAVNGRWQKILNFLMAVSGTLMGIRWHAVQG